MLYELNLETADVDQLGQILQFVDEHLEALNCPMKAQMQIDIAVEEIFVNIASYAYAPEEGPVTLRIDREENPAAISITFIDSGVPFDPLARQDPDVTLSAEERQIGGLGIYTVKQSMDSVTYTRENGQNILTLSKTL